ncbi:MAG: DUF5362 domain-containing protein [candidate division WOR-3 bacterium]
MEASVSTDLNQQQLLANIRGMKGWLKFIGILTLIMGILQALSLIGILWAWLPIWMGIILTQAGSRAQEYAERNDPAALTGLTSKLRTYFVIQGVLLIVSLCLAVLGGILAIVLGLFAGGLPELLKQYGFGG